MNNEQPLVSVCIRSYNQSSFIREAIDSVLSQRINFKLEIIISDDCSIDGTQEILHQYQRKFEVIRLLENENNIGGPNNLRAVIEASQAKYICCLDGDDFFTDIYKLQKQVNFLESHSNYSACFHNTWLVDKNGRKLGLFNKPDFHSVHYAEEFIQEQWFIPIHSALIRRDLIDFPEWYYTVMNDDYVVHLSVVKHGPYYFMSDVMAAYRKHNDEISLAYLDIVLIDKKLKSILEKMKPLYPLQYANCFDKRILKYEKEINQEILLAHPLLKWFHRKTYTRKLKSILKNNYDKFINH